ncbi:TetR/AcrR family transcriptional regulator [Microbacteriaceae bacterium VKM Ac-2855]|nr:TetR/AcrR family transcriptional regulator [Microbacteriaceae bacterium VKM Ac-2855]
MSTRERILDAATTLFYTEGITAVGVDRISSEAGVSKRSLYQHFGTKEALAGEVFGRDEPRFAVLAAADAIADPTERIRAVFSSLITTARAAGFHGCPYLNAAAELHDPDAPAAEASRRRKAGLTAFFRQNAAALADSDPDALAAQLTMLYDGAAAWTVMRTEAPPAALLDAVDVLLAARRGRPGDPGVAYSR